MKYVVKKTAMYGSSTYGPYGSYQEALDASKELEKYIQRKLLYCRTGRRGKQNDL